MTQHITLAHVNPQPWLPIRFDSKRGSDSIRARVYADPRLSALEWRVAMALSEFVNTSTWCAHPKQSRIAVMVNATRPKVSGALHSLESKGVINIDRCRTFARYVFTETWRSAFRPASRCSPTEHLDVPLRNITGEPENRNLPPKPPRKRGSANRPDPTGGYAPSPRVTGRCQCGGLLLWRVGGLSTCTDCGGEG
jgi:hypothetical protein